MIKPETGKEYIYYRCSRYNTKGHPRIRLNESKLDEQILALLARLKQPEPVRDWFADMLRLWIQDEQQQSRSTADDIQRELTNLRTQQDRSAEPPPAGRDRSRHLRPEEHRSCATVLPRSHCNSNPHIASATSTRTSRRRCLNFRKA